MPELQRLRADHEAAVLAFELANRAYFAASIADRGDDFYRRFTERHAASLAEQDAGMNAFYVLVDEGAVLGRFNLYALDEETPSLGYRMAEHAAGRGLATSTVREVCRLAAAQYGLRVLTAAASEGNAASRTVLIRTGFVAVGPADPGTLGGKQGTLYRRELEVE